MTALYYHRHSSMQKRDGLKLIERLSVKEGDRVLDIGCGTGHLAAVLSEIVGEGGRIIAVDPNNDRIELAQEMNSAKNIKYVVASDVDFPTDHKYDNVVCTDVIHWIKEKERTFKRVYNSLRPGGRFGFTTFSSEPKHHPILFEMFPPEVLPEVIDLAYNTLTPEKYQELATLTGFEVTFMDIFETEMHFSDINAFVDYFYSNFPGKFDPNSPTIESIKEKYKGQELVRVLPRLTVILTKPLL